MVGFVGLIGPLRGPASKALACRRLSVRVAANEPDSDEPKAASWRDELRYLLDGRTSMDTRGVLLFDLLKRSPEIADELLGDVRENSGVENIPQVANQVVTDLLPEIQKKGPALASQALEELPNLPTIIPRVLDEAREFTEKNRDDLPNIIKTEAKNIFTKTPEGLETPKYEVLYKANGFEVRKYTGLLIAQTTMDAVDDTDETAVANARGASFNKLASYLFGSNEAQESMSMTTPVVLASMDEKTDMYFLMPSQYSKDTAPLPSTEDVSLEEVPEVIVAVKEFPGFATAGECKRQLDSLLADIEGDETTTLVNPGGSMIMQYNPPYTVPWLRRNEVQVNVYYTPTESDASVVV